MPDGTVLTYDVKECPARRALQSRDPTMDLARQHGRPTWPDRHRSIPIPYGKNKTYYPPGEVGPGMLLPNGTVFATGATPAGKSSGNTAIYTPGPKAAKPAPGPPVPNFPQ